MWCCTQVPESGEQLVTVRGDSRAEEAGSAQLLPQCQEAVRDGDDEPAGSAVPGLAIVRG